MTKLEKTALEAIALRIDDFADIENARINFETCKNYEIKEDIYFYMKNFFEAAEDLRTVIDLMGQRGNEKERRLQEIIKK